MECEKLIVTQDTQIKDVIQFLNITFEEFYGDCIADNINRADFWRNYNCDDHSFTLTKKGD
jgi:hypothetical protein